MVTGVLREKEKGDREDRAMWKHRETGRDGRPGQGTLTTGGWEPGRRPGTDCPSGPPEGPSTTTSLIASFALPLSPTRGPSCCFKPPSSCSFVRTATGSEHAARPHTGSTWWPTGPRHTGRLVSSIRSWIWGWGWHQTNSDSPSLPVSPRPSLGALFFSGGSFCLHLWKAQGVGCGESRHPQDGLLVMGGLEREVGKPSVTTCPAHSARPVQSPAGQHSCGAQTR